MVSNIFYFHPYLGKISNLTCAYFSDGLVQPPTRYIYIPFLHHWKDLERTFYPSRLIRNLKKQQHRALSKWVFGKGSRKLGGGNSNIFGFFTLIWGNHPFWLIFFKWVLKPPTRKDMQTGHGFQTGHGQKKMTKPS